GRQFAVIDAIGLFESGLGEQCSLTVAVIADPEVRVKRLMARDSISEAYARARIAAQKPARWYAEQADLVLENNGTEAEFEGRCREMLQKKLFKEENHDESP
ncbi:MAG: dephospho-CoA kinase, partial [Oscillospiraceae bacterium]|nr:dephospho-CoA kinase [Oscillospiraceae bacterium]